MTDTLLTNGRIVTQNDRREIIEDGAVAITDDRITAVGTAKELEATHDADRVIDAEGCAVVPGLVGPHIHVSDILLRGAFAEDLGLYEWLFDVRQPVLSAMTPADHELAARLYCVEAIQSGMTAFVENDLSLDWHDLAPTRRKLAAYDEMGVRNIYGAGIRDQRAGEAFEQLFETVTGDGDRDPYPLVVETAEAFDGVESLIESRHDPDGRQSVWPAPATLGTTTAEALRRAYDLAETHDVMTTTHVAQAETEEEGALSSIEYLRNIGYLGDRALLGHCVQTDDRDVRILAETGTAVAHNFRANMLTATGFAPAVEMLDRGVPVGAGTDNAILNDTINPLSDARAVATAHKGYHMDTGVISAQEALDMVTCLAAEAIGKGDRLGSLEADTQADIAIVDLDYPHLTPSPDPVRALIYGLQGFEIETVLCAGNVLMEERELVNSEDSVEDITSAATETATDIIDRAGVE